MKASYFHTASAYGYPYLPGHYPVDHRYTQLCDIGDLVFILSSREYGVLVALEDGVRGYVIQTLNNEKLCVRTQFRLADISELDRLNRSERRFFEVHCINAKNRHRLDVVNGDLLVG